jgi:hypothetical protein
MSYSTYEFAKAQECSASNPDKIHYDKGAAFRKENYRQLFHQDNKIGHISVRLLEAADLDRRYWSALALGPMKHLGLSKAHGEISSFVSFCLDTNATSTNNIRTSSSAVDDYDKKIPAATKFSVDGATSTSTMNMLHQLPTYVSPVVPKTNNPVWADCQFELPLHKGAFQDGEPVRIFLRVEEDSTPLENMIPGIASAGGVARLLGVGHLDVTNLCLGQHPITGRPITEGVLDAWVPIKLPDEQEQKPFIALGAHDDELKKPSYPIKGDKANGMGGRVRVLITYHPHGMNPQRNDIVALEAFARQNLRTATCHSIIPPLLPLHVIEVKEPWLLVKYRLPFETDNNMYNHGINENDDDRKACMRIHRNAVFVIERKNLMDATMNIVLQPAEFVLSTPLGRSAQEILGPLIVASKQLMMPAILSSKLLWMAVRATALASFTGMAAAGTAFVSEGTSSLTNDGRRQMQRKRPDDNGMVRYV